MQNIAELTHLLAVTFVLFAVLGGLLMTWLFSRTVELDAAETSAALDAAESELTVSRMPTSALARLLVSEAEQAILESASTEALLDFLETGILPAELDGALVMERPGVWVLQEPLRAA